jgi:hypothetical protein
VLARIQDGFHTMVKARSREGQGQIDITCFFEELPLPGVGQVGPKAWFIVRGWLTSGTGGAAALGNPPGIHPDRHPQQSYGHGQICLCGRPRVHGCLRGAPPVDQGDRHDRKTSRESTRLGPYQKVRR